MEIFVDADACPVKEIIVRTAKQYGLSVTMLCDASHILNDGYSRVITVEKGRDSADIALINLAHAGDIVVTQDYGVAALALGKKAFAINQNGLIYSDKNIDMLLFERHIGQEVRRRGGRTHGQKKRSAENDLAFEKAFVSLIERNKS